MVGIGINENAVLSKAAVNDKGVLETVWREKSSASVDPLAGFTGADIVDDNTSTSRISVFPFDSKAPAYDADKVIDAAEVTKRYRENVSNPLKHILSAYMTLDKIAAAHTLEKVFANTGVVVTETGSNLAERIMLEDVQMRLYDNTVRIFTELIAPFVDKDEHAVRLLLVRQSKDKAYASYRTQYINKNPFIEPMTVSKEQSKLAFTKWEIDNKRDSAAIADKAPSTADTTSQPVVDPFAG